MWMASVTARRQKMSTILWKWAEFAAMMLRLILLTWNRPLLSLVQKSGQHIFSWRWKQVLTYYAPARRERASKRCFCPSVRPSVAYIANNSRTQRPSVPKFGRKVPHIGCESHTSFKVKRSKVRATGQLTQTHQICHIFRTVRPKNFKGGVGMEDVDPHQRRRAPWPPQGHMVCLTRLGHTTKFALGTLTKYEE